MWGLYLQALPLVSDKKKEKEEEEEEEREEEEGNNTGTRKTFQKLPHGRPSSHVVSLMRVPHPHQPLPSTHGVGDRRTE